MLKPEHFQISLDDAQMNDVILALDNMFAKCQNQPELAKRYQKLLFLFVERLEIGGDNAQD